ncbi:MAG: Holliday junction branch migration protein RuvA [Candidatus Pacebacteria bacterium]|nr:Holliday junction branch migration protein RuvA [Candidatus Paceibacterota bacterium]
MIAYLSGKIVKKADNFVILNVNGVGYEVFLSEQSMGKLPEQESDFKCFCYLEANERAMKLFGFLSFEELELFKVIRNIQGAGPKASLEISSIGSLEKIKALMDKGNLNFLDGISGIGEKRAQKIILELTGKIKSLSDLSKKDKEVLESDEAYLALIKLGFSKEKAKQAILELPKEIKNTQERIKNALQILGK